MNRRRKTKVSLAKLACMEPPTQEKQVRRMLETFRNSGYRKPEGPSVERLLKAGEAAKVETFSEIVEVESWLGESGQNDKWLFCLTASMIGAHQERL
jgi:hypothetical protein